MTSHISFHNVTKDYTVTHGGGIGWLGRGQKVRAVDSLDLEISSGERVGLIGVNGAGKSTILQLISDLTQPTEGRVSISGEVHPLLTLGTGLQEEASGNDNIVLGAGLRNVEDKHLERLKRDVAEFSGLGEKLNHPVRTYSSGMKSRLAFAMACHINPDILLIDEVLSVGDAQFSKKAQAKFMTLCEAGNIVVIVSHNLPSLAHFCTRGIWIEKGRIRMDGDIHEVIEAYSNDTAHRKVDTTLSVSSNHEAISPSSNVAIGAPRSIVVGDSLDIHIPLSELVERQGQFRLMIEREDGVVLFESDIPNHFFSERRHNKAGSQVKLTLANMVMSAGTYMVILNDAGNPCGRAVIDVLHNRPYHSDRPVVDIDIHLTVATQS